MVSTLSCCVILLLQTPWFYPPCLYFRLWCWSHLIVFVFRSIGKIQVLFYFNVDVRFVTTQIVAVLWYCFVLLLLNISLLFVRLIQLHLRYCFWCAWFWTPWAHFIVSGVRFNSSYWLYHYHFFRLILWCPVCIVPFLLTCELVSVSFIRRAVVHRKISSCFFHVAVACFLRQKFLVFTYQMTVYHHLQHYQL